MKKYIFTLFFLISTLALQAQIMGEVSVRRKTLAKEGNKLTIELEVKVDRNAVRRNESWAILPELSTSDRQSVVLFPHILINGHYQQHMMERKATLTGKYWSERKPHMIIEASKTLDQQFTYKYQVPYKEWMKDASLVLRQILTTPGEERRVFTVDVNGAVDVK